MIGGGGGEWLLGRQGGESEEGALVGYWSAEIIVMKGISPL